jgi:FkbM family methyltransferase
MRFNADHSALSVALGLVEPEVQQALTRLLAEGDVMYDIGASAGFFSLLGARLVGPTGRVYAFEPVPEVADALRHNAEINRLDQVAVKQIALSSHSGQAVLVLVPTNSWRLEEFGAPEHRRRSLSVQLATVDELVAAGELEPPSLVKIDVDGAELEVIRGMEATLRRHRPVVVCELHDTNREFVALMRSNGYTVQPLEGDEAVETAHWNVHALATPSDV